MVMLKIKAFYKEFFLEEELLGSFHHAYFKAGVISVISKTFFKNLLSCAIN